MARVKKAVKLDQAIKEAREDEAVKNATVTKGSHLTVTTYPDGRTELEWDDEALVRDVRDAIASYESQVETVVGITEEKVKKTRARKVKA